MTIQELKKQIINNSLSNDFLILKYTDNTFIIDQYIEAIAKNKKYNINKISDLASTVNSALALVFDFDSQLNILRTEVFNEIAEDYDQFKNCIVICKEISKEIADKVKIYTVDIPKLIDWQIIDYIKQQCSGLEEDEIKWLYEATERNILRINEELYKIMLFNDSDQRRVLNELRFEPNSDLFIKPAVYDLVEAILSKNKLFLMECLTHKDYLNIFTFAVISGLINKACKCLFVNFKSGVDLTKLNMTERQIKGIKYYNKDYSESYLTAVLKFLTKIDQRLKLGQLDMNQNQLTDYIICNLLAIK